MAHYGSHRARFRPGAAAGPTPNRPSALVASILGTYEAPLADFGSMFTQNTPSDSANVVEDQTQRRIHSTSCILTVHLSHRYVYLFRSRVLTLAVHKVAFCPSIAQTFKAHSCATCLDRTTCIYVSALFGTNSPPTTIRMLCPAILSYCILRMAQALRAIFLLVPMA
jgi:hypothetical protein